MGDAPARNTRDRILEVAAELFARHGMRKTSIQDIADRSGLAKGALYYYFESKEAVFAAVLQAEVDLMWERVRSAVDQVQTPSEKLLAHFTAAMAAFRESPIASQTIHDELMEHLVLATGIRVEARQREIAGVREILARGMAAGEFRPMNCERVAEILVSSFEGVICSPEGIQRNILDDQNQPAEMLNLLLYGLRAAPEPAHQDISLMSFLIAFLGGSSAPEGETET